MAKDPIKKATNGTYYFRANLGYHPMILSIMVDRFSSRICNLKLLPVKMNSIVVS